MVTSHISRRGLLGGLLATVFSRSVPQLPESISPLRSMTLNPFSPGSSETLTQMIVALMDDFDEEAHWKTMARYAYTAEMRRMMGSENIELEMERFRRGIEVAQREMRDSWVELDEDAVDAEGPSTKPEFPFILHERSFGSVGSHLIDIVVQPAAPQLEGPTNA